ncbi:MAG: aldehyde ferredoxin oxidoreductase N-terminal domain-containing protein [Anaerolineales bacterium]
MKEIAVNVERFAPLHGWVNRILRVDLSNGSIEVEPVEPYVPDYLGGRGLAARLAWEDYPDPVDALAPENPLMVMAGALTGTVSPYSGRAAVCGFSPQAYPYSWFTRANIGAQWGAELKKAGYDGIIVTGASDTPVQIVIRDDEVRIAPADHLWGLDTYETMEALENEVDSRVKPLIIGPAGERLSRIATIHAATSSAAGQGGFGAVMGSKKLKAISVVGSGRVSVAHREEFRDFVGAVRNELRPNRPLRDLESANEKLESDRGGRVRHYACTAACPTPCNRYYTNMPGVAHPERTYEGHMACVGSCFPGQSEDGPISYGGLYDWNLGLYGGFEMNVLSNRYGLNQWDLIVSMVPWLERCQNAGLVDEMNGMPMDWQDPEFWAQFLHAIAYREGMGDALAKGGLRASEELGMGQGFARRYYTGWGYGGHWDAHACWLNYLVFPYWLVSTLQWSTDTRDPYSSSHGYVQNIMRWAPFAIRNWREVEVTWDHIRGISERVYGSAEALDPRSGYKEKAYPAYYHDKRSVMKDCVPTDDQVFPLIYSVTSEDRFFRVGEVEGPSVDYHLFRLGTGTEWDEEEFEQAAERIYTLERALCVRHWGRDRGMDDSVLPSFTYEENWENPILGEKYALDREKIEPVRKEYYQHLGWDPSTGRPTRKRLCDLDLEDIYEPMISGAEEAEERRPEWPEWPPPEV